MYHKNSESDLGKTKSRRKNPAKEKRSGKEKKNYALVETIGEQVKFLHRFKNLCGKSIKTANLLSFIKALQKAIHEKRIRKSDKYAHEIDNAQKISIAAYQNAKGMKAEMKVPKPFFERLNEIAKSEKVRPSVAFLKRFIGMIGKPYTEVSARMKKTLDAFEKMFESGTIRKSDPYFSKVEQAHQALEAAVKTKQRIKIPAATLNGLNEIIEEPGAGFL